MSLEEAYLSCVDQRWQIRRRSHEPVRGESNPPRPAALLRLALAHGSCLCGRSRWVDRVTSISAVELQHL